MPTTLALGCMIGRHIIYTIPGHKHRAARRVAGGMAAQAQRLAEQGILRADVTVDAATDLLCLLTSFDSFDLLYAGRGLTAAGAAELLITAAERSLCQPFPGAS